MTAVDEFTPAHAIVVSNKDEIIIPLLLDPLPAPKPGRDAIESLSPEQQDFCRAFRAMQLASSLFGILVVQVKPQLEAVLNLPAGAPDQRDRALVAVDGLPADLLRADRRALVRRRRGARRGRQGRGGKGAPPSTISKMVADARERDLAAKKAEARRLARARARTRFSLPECEEEAECAVPL